jgi:hypothetical protein
MKESLRLVFLEISKSLNDNLKVVQAFQMSMGDGSDIVATGASENPGRDSSGSSGGNGD